MDPSLDRNHRKRNGSHETRHRQSDCFGRNPLSEQRDGNPQTVADELKRWEDAGHTHGTIQSTWLGFTEPQQHLDYFAKVAALMGR